MPRRKTNEEFLLELKAKQITVIPLEPYINNDTKILFRCNVCDYEWKTLPRTITTNHGCPKCANLIKMTTEEFSEKMRYINPDIQVIGEYEGASSRILVKCKKCGHEWVPSAGSIMSQGTGCPKCAGNIKLTNEQFSMRVREKSPSIILKSEYVNTKSLIKCECKKCGYEWETTAASLKIGSQCPKCAGNIKKTQGEFTGEVRRVLPTVLVKGVYKNARTKITVSCKVCNCEWSAKPNNLLHGEGCPNCAQRARTAKQTKPHEEFIKQLSQRNPNIKVIGKYTNSHNRVECKCKLCGYSWKPLAMDILRGTGCPECSTTSTSYMEQLMLQALRLVLGSDTVISRDAAAVGMELDIFIPAYNLAIEPGSWFWHVDKIERDREKREACKKRGIQLLTVYDSYCEKEAPFADNCLVFSYDIGVEEQHPTIKRLVEEVLKGINRPHIFEDGEWAELENIAYIKSRKQTTEEFIKRLKLVNDNVEVVGQYKGSKIKISCKCRKCGHEWSASPSHLLNGKGCPKCGGHARKTFEDFVKDLNKANPSIVLLSNEYRNSQTKVHVTCKICGNKWQAKPANLLLGYGCPVCAKDRTAKKNRLTHEQFLDRMKTKGNPNVIVVEKYVDSKTKLACVCNICGNEWLATPNTLLQGHGCKKCADLAKGRGVQEWNLRKKQTNK